MTGHRADADETLGDLMGRLERYPADRYPVQHATAAFHLGVRLADRGDLAEAEAALATAAGLFAPRGLAPEHGKALNALGAVLRMAGRPADAVAVLDRAVATLGAADLPAEQSAAWFNLGLVQREAGDLAAAAVAFERARAGFQAVGAPGQAAGAGRELGATRFFLGDLAGARAALEGVPEAAAHAGDEAGAGAAANVRGLVELAAAAPHDATRWFAQAAALHPRRLRPADHAMAKANLALAHDRAGDELRARVAARQALGTPEVPPAVREQAHELLARGRGDPSDVMTLLADADDDERRTLVRDELARLSDAGEPERRAAAAAWVDGQLARPAEAIPLAKAWIAGLFEVPPRDMKAVLESLVRALDERPADDREAFRRQVASASARFHVPQMLRLRDMLNAIAADVGAEPAWR